MRAGGDAGAGWSTPRFSPSGDLKTNAEKQLNHWRRQDDGELLDSWIPLSLHTDGIVTEIKSL